MSTTRTPLAMILGTALLAAPVIAFGQAVAPTSPPGTVANPPGTAATRALDSALGTNVSGANPAGHMMPAGARRASKLIGANVYNENGDSIGEIDDILVFATAAPAPMPQAAPATPPMAPATTTPPAAMAPVTPPMAPPASTAMPATPAMPVPAQPITAVVSVGGFLGIGAKLVSVPLAEMTWNAERERWTLPGATKETLQARPAFSYDQRRG